MVLPHEEIENHTYCRSCGTRMTRSTTQEAFYDGRTGRKKLSTYIVLTCPNWWIDEYGTCERLLFEEE